MVKTFITSIPKSGTYLVREILEQAGLGRSHLHISESGIFDYSKISFEEGRRNPRKCKTYMTLEKSLALIPENSFGVGHLACTNQAIDLLKGFNVIFVGRDIKEVYLSFMIYQLETGRAHRYPEDNLWVKEKDPEKQFLKFIGIRGNKLMTKYFTRILPWIEQKNVACFDFNVLRNNPVNEVKRLIEPLDMPFTDEQIKQIVTNSFDKKTQTLSHKKDRSAYWSNQAHQQIEKLIKKYNICYSPK